MKPTLIFFSYIILMVLLGLSAFGVHNILSHNLTSGASIEGVGPGFGFILLIHVIAACGLTAFCWVSINDTDSK